MNVNDTLSGAGTLGEGLLGLTNEAGGVIDAISFDPGAGLTLDAAGTMVNAGLIEATTGYLTMRGLVANTGTIVSGASGPIDLTGGVDIAGGLLEGTYSVDNGTLDGSVSPIDITGVGAASAGTITVQPGGTLTLLGSIVDSGLLSLGPVGNCASLVVASPTVTFSGGGEVRMNMLSEDPYNIPPQLAAYSEINTTANTDVLDNINDTIDGAGDIPNLINNAAGVIDADIIDKLVAHCHGSALSSPVPVVNDADCSKPPPETCVWPPSTANPVVARWREPLSMAPSTSELDIGGTLVGPHRVVGGGVVCAGGTRSPV